MLGMPGVGDITNMSPECLNALKTISESQGQIEPDEEYNNPELSVLAEEKGGSPVAGMFKSMGFVFISLEDGQGCFATETEICMCQQMSQSV